MTADLSALDIERRWTAIESTLPTSATEADIQSLRADIQAMRTEWKTDLGEIRAEFGEMKADLHAREARLITWVAGLAAAHVRRRSDSAATGGVRA